MNKRLFLSGMLVALISSPVFAEDGIVPERTLSSLGLGGLEMMSDSEGMEVRGTASASSLSVALFFGQSALSGQDFANPNITETVQGSLTLTSFASEEETDADASSSAEVSQGGGLPAVLFLDIAGGTPDSAVSGLGITLGGTGP